MDTHNNRPFKASVRSKLLKLRSQKYQLAKEEAAKNPLQKGRVGIPKTTQEEIVTIMLEAWEELDPQLGANAWVEVKLMPYELAQIKGWTPKEASKDIRHLDWPWQSVSKIKPVDAGSDIEAIERDNVPELHYEGTKTPAEVREALALSQQETSEHACEQPFSDHNSSSPNASIEPTASTVPAAPMKASAPHKERTAPSSNQTQSIQESQSGKWSVLIQNHFRGTHNCTKTKPTTSHYDICAQRPSGKMDPLGRAELRMLQEALKASMEVQTEGLTPVKSNDGENDSYLPTYNKLLEAQGKSAMKALNVEDLPLSIHSDGFGVLSPEEVDLIHQTKQAHKAFMSSRRQCALIFHVLGEQNVALVDSLISKSDIRKCEINQNFRLFDLIGLLSYRPVTYTAMGESLARREKV